MSGDRRPMTVRTPRLVLSPLRPHDLEALHAHWTEPEVREYLWDGRVVSTDEVGDVIGVSDRLFEEHGAGLWRVDLAATPGLVGCAGFWHFHDPPELELLLSLSRRAWGGGLAREAATALLGFVFERLGWNVVQASADAPNERSLRLLRGLGMHPAGDRPGAFGRIEVYRLGSEDWRGPGSELERLRYPIGRFRPRAELSVEEVRACIADLAALPADFRAAVSDLPADRLDAPYRPGGWTVLQVVHHVPDSHLNGYVRFKLALTEEEPTIKAYDEAAWAELPDGRGEDVEGSLLLLEAVHRRWTHLLRSLDREQLALAFHHPEGGRTTLEQSLQLYAWHGRHHLAHVTGLRERMGW